MRISDLVAYFTDGVEYDPPEDKQVIGTEIETMFVDHEWGGPISVSQAYGIMGSLSVRPGWGPADENGLPNIVKVCSDQGDVISFELGRHNIEVSLRPIRENGGNSVYGQYAVLNYAREVLGALYEEASKHGAIPYFFPTMAWPENLLIIPDERDETWLKLDGVKPLNLLARTSAVQFTFTVSPGEAIQKLNNLGRRINDFLSDYPQDAWWHRYIKESNAHYDPMRYGGPLQFESIEDYCRKLAVHAVVTPNGLVPFAEVSKLDIPLYLRSVWWYFRLRRFGNKLCIEVRPMPRRTDAHLANQLHAAWSATMGCGGGNINPIAAACARFGTERLASLVTHDYSF